MCGVQVRQKHRVKVQDKVYLVSRVGEFDIWVNARDQVAHRKRSGLGYTGV